MTGDAGGPLDAGVLRFDVFTGAAVGGGPADPGGLADQGVLFAELRERLAPPRYCGVCGRRMVVQVRPDGWWARCSRHGRADSSMLDER